MEFIVRECPNNGILGGPFEKTITAYIGQQHSLAEISIEQFGERIITVHTVEDASIYDLHHLYFDLKRLIMLMDGQFYPITSVTRDGVEITTSIQKKICRDIANRFNNLHPNTFTIPEGYYPKVGEGAKITSLVDPNSKMSKSDPNPNGYILLMDKPEDIMRKFKRAVTDSDSRIIFDPQNKPGVSNLLQIYALATGKTIEQAAAEFDGKGYGEFKPAVGEAVVELLRPIREKTTDLLNNKDYLEQVYKEGAQKASYLARKTLDKVYRKVGFVAR